MSKTTTPAILAPAKKFFVSPALWAALALVAQTALNTSISNPQTEVAEATVSKGLQQLHPRVLKILSLGFLPAMVDWLWIQSLVDPTITPVKKGEHAALYYRAQLITDLDPAFYESYVDAGHLLAIVRKDTEGSLALTRKAEKFIREALPLLPEEFRERFWTIPWRAHVLGAYLYLFELDDLPNAGKQFQAAAKLPGAPEYLGQLSERLEKPSGVYEVGLRLLNFMIRITNDGNEKRHLEEKRRSLFLAQYVFEVETAFREFLKGIPEYRFNPEVPRAKLSGYWSRFLRDTRTPAQDPFGGRIFLSPEGHVASTTPREIIFGIK